MQEGEKRLCAVLWGDNHRLFTYKYEKSSVEHRRGSIKVQAHTTEECGP